MMRTLSDPERVILWWHAVLGKGYNRAEYLDNFKEDDAKEFLKTLLGEKAASLTDPVWREVFENVAGTSTACGCRLLVATRCHWRTLLKRLGPPTHQNKQRGGFKSLLEVKKWAHSTHALHPFLAAIEKLFFAFCFNVALQMAMAETRDLISSVVGEPCSPRPLFLPFAKLVVAMLASEPPNIEVKSAIEKLKDPALYPATSSAATDAGQREDTLLLRDGKPIRDVAWAALNQLVASNLILVRPFSVWAGDHG
eukprot:1156879-Pelagomonas_calceolata.AAC.6